MRFKSVSIIAAAAETNALAPATTGTIVCQESSTVNVAMNNLAKTYTPILTSKAACSRAVTGEGATPASGSHVWKGSVADLAKMPASSKTTAIFDKWVAPRVSFMVWRSNEPVCW